MHILELMEHRKESKRGSIRGTILIESRSVKLGKKCQQISPPVANLSPEFDRGGPERAFLWCFGVGALSVPRNDSLCADAMRKEKSHF
jgi:hypothetical protein